MSQRAGLLAQKSVIEGEDSSHRLVDQEIVARLKSQLQLYLQKAKILQEENFQLAQRVQDGALELQNERHTSQQLQQRVLLLQQQIGTSQASAAERMSLREERCQELEKRLREQDAQVWKLQSANSELEQRLRGSDAFCQRRVDEVRQEVEEEAHKMAEQFAKTSEKAAQQASEKAAKAALEFEQKLSAAAEKLKNIQSSESELLRQLELKEAKIRELETQVREVEEQLRESRFQVQDLAQSTRNLNQMQAEEVATLRDDFDYKMTVLATENANLRRMREETARETANAFSLIYQYASNFLLPTLGSLARVEAITDALSRAEAAINWIQLHQERKAQKEAAETQTIEAESQMELFQPQLQSQLLRAENTQQCTSIHLETTRATVAAETVGNAETTTSAGQLSPQLEAQSTRSLSRTRRPDAAILRPMRLESQVRAICGVSQDNAQEFDAYWLKAQQAADFAFAARDGRMWEVSLYRDGLQLKVDVNARLHGAFLMLRAGSRCRIDLQWLQLRYVIVDALHTVELVDMRGNERLRYAYFSNQVACVNFGAPIDAQRVVCGKKCLLLCE